MTDERCPCSAALPSWERNARTTAQEGTGSGGFRGQAVRNRVAFKFLPGLETLFLANAKYAHRGSSGKFVTVYPSDESECERILAELGDVLDGLPGRCILSDLRWRDGPLHVRYGALADRHCDNTVRCIAHYHPDCRTSRRRRTRTVARPVRLRAAVLEARHLRFRARGRQLDPWSGMPPPARAAEG
ncbi:class III lanthionine synthetase LanKC N-terminal domain-containing protein [Streptomyces rishiriensis]|uniref:class III lanthionine synthetase LanKC N-terminal domain-containing protein n=1 Tax=Streptomyces rishiriensis TaxID=68264 RepID=UPI00403B24E7